MLKLIILLLIYFTVGRLEAQYVFSGKVFNEKKEPIANASLKIKDSLYGITKYFGITNSEGSFNIKLPISYNHFLVECSFIGYKSSNYRIETPKDNNRLINRNFIMSIDTSKLQDINVYAIPPIKVSGDTITFRTESFKQENESTVSDLLNNIPGFSVEDGKIKYNGKAVSRVLIEDDDLFGRDYTAVTQNLSPKGIEKIELIKNYNDKTYLSNRLQKGNELVVNLKFNKKYIYKILASNEIATNKTLTLYKLRQNIISLVPKIKFVTTTNLNNTGILGSELLGIKDVMPDVFLLKNDAVNFDMPSRSPSTILAQIPSITSSIVPKNKLVFNRTGVITNNLLYKISEKVIFKNIVQFYQDSYDQQQYKTENYVISGSSLIVTDQQFLVKKIPIWNISSECIYSLNSRSQLVYKINFNTNNEKDSSADIRQSKNINNSLAISARNWQQQLGISFALDSTKILDIRAGMISANSQQYPIVYPADLFKSLTLDSFFTTIRSTIVDKHHEYNVQARISAREKKGFYTLEVLYTKGDSKINSQASLFTKDSSLSINQSFFYNNLQWEYSIGSLGFEITKQLTKKSSIQVLQKLETGNIQFIDNNSLNINKHFLNYLPSIDLKLNINNKQNIEILWSIKNKLPTAYDILPSNVIISSKDIIRGSSSLNMGISEALSFKYSYTDPIKQKILFFVVVSHSKESILYLSNKIPKEYYTTTNKVILSDYSTTWSAFSTLSKYISRIKSQVSIEMATLYYDSYYSTNNTIGPLKITSFIPNLKCKTLITNRLTAGIGAKISFTTQSLNEGQIDNRQINSHSFNYSTDVTYRFSQSWVFNLRYQNIVQNQNSETNYLNLCDAAIQYILRKDKLRFNLSANNIFSNNQFVSTSFTQMSTIKQTINMQPSFILLQATFEL